VTTFLFIWNPKIYKWKNYFDLVDEFHKKGELSIYWSCGTRKDLPRGSRVFLMSVGEDPKGLIASGRSTSAPYKVSGDKAMSVDVKLDAFSDFPILTERDLRRTVSRQFNWTPQGSGIKIPTAVARKLEQEWKRERVPDTAAYVRALRSIRNRLTDTQKALLVAQYHAPEHTVTATQLAHDLGLSGKGVVNLQYGTLGKMLRHELRFRGKGQETYVLSSFYKPGKGRDRQWRFVMHPQVASALERLGWVSRGKRKIATKYFAERRPVTHVLIGDKEGDLAALQRAGKDGDILEWTVPKSAIRNQKAVFFVGTSFVGEGRLVSTPVKSEHGAPKYRAHLGKIDIYEEPIPLSSVRQQLPKWKWASYPRGYTSLTGQAAETLAKILQSYQVKQTKAERSAKSAVEGVRREVVGSMQGRNRGLRQSALNRANGVCASCGKNYAKVLSGLGLRVLQVHHRKQLSALKTPKINTVKDLAVVCANCHMLIHSDIKRAIPVETLAAMLRRYR